MYELRFILFSRFFAFLAIFYFSFISPQATVSSETGNVPNPNKFVKKHFVPLAYFIIDNSEKPLVGAQESGESKESREEMLHLNSVAPVLMEIIDLVLSLFFPPNSRQRAVVFRMGAMLLLHTIYNTIWYIYIYILYVYIISLWYLTLSK